MDTFAIDASPPKTTPWHSRGYLPHFEGGERAQFITFRLFDSMPQKMLLRWQRELQGEPDFDYKLRQRIEAYLDQGYGKCYLRRPAVATEMQNSLLYHAEVKYRLISWVIMPNHLHCLLVPVNESSLSSIMHSFKSYTANKANNLLNRAGKFWQKEHHDRFIRNEEHYFNAIRYIEMNPVKAGLCKKPESWPFGSARYFKDS